MEVSACFILLSYRCPGATLVAQMGNVDSIPTDIEGRHVLGVSVAQ